MKLARLALAHGPTLVAVDDAGGIAVADVLDGCGNDPDVVGILADHEALAVLQATLTQRPDPALALTETTRVQRPLRDVTRVLSIGLNYRDHAAEVGLDLPGAPLLFSRWASSLADPYADVVVPGDVVTQLDHEVELAAVVGRELWRVDADTAADAIVGWTVANDLSARDLQFADGQWTRGKNVDGTCPVGPAVVPAHDLDVSDVRLSCRVDDEVRQDSTTANLVFSTADVLAHLSRTMRLGPGDLVLTGTPAGVSLGSPEPRWLRDDQVVRCEVEGIGAIQNRIRFDPPVRGA